MIEIFNNLFQLAVLLCCSAYAFYSASKVRSREWLVYGLFCATYFLGDVWWALYLLFYGETSSSSIIPYISWYASYLFLLVLLLEFSTRSKNTRYFGPVLWLVPLLTGGLCAFYMQYGAYLNNLITALLMTGLMWVSLGGLMALRKEPSKEQAVFFGKQILQITMLFCLAAYAMYRILLGLWESSQESVRTFQSDRNMQHPAVHSCTQKGGERMNYIENVYICLAAPFLIAVLCLVEEHRRTMFFILCGMTVCLLSSYISTFLAAAQGMDLGAAAINISPVVEEAMKLMPVLFYLLVFEPAREKAVGALLMIAIGFATFENACYLTQNGAENLIFLLIRGFGTGAMHVVCGMIVAMGLRYLWNQNWLRAAGIAGLLTVAVTFHGIYNMMVAQNGAIAMAAYLMPMATVIIVMTLGKDAIRRSN